MVTCRTKTGPGMLCLVAAALLLMAGCAHEKAYKRAEKLSKEGQYEQAIQELESAVRLAEEHNSHKAAQRYRDRLDEVKRQAAQYYYHEAQMRFGWADLTAARGFIEKAMAHLPQELTYRVFHERVLKATTEAETLRTTAMSLAEQQQWQTAIQRMKEALAIYKTMPGGEADLNHIHDRAYRYYLDRAQGRLSENDLTQAEAEAQTALLYQTDGKEAKAMIQTVKDRREAAGLIAHGLQMLEQGRAEDALQDLERAAKLYPSQTDLPDLLGRARRAVCEGWLAQGRQALEARQYVKALHLFDKSRDLLAGYGGVDALLVDTTSRLAQSHLEASRRCQQERANGAAVLHAVAALGYLPESFEARTQLTQCAELLRQDVEYTIAFAGFAADPARRDLATAFAAAAIEHLTRTRPANVTVVERPDLHTSSNERLSADGIDTIIEGQILEANVTTEIKRSGYGEATYQDGYRPEPNPDHIQAAKELDVAVDELEHARQRLAEAEERLARFRHVNPADPEQMERRHRAEMEVEEARHHLAEAAARVGEARARLGAIPPEVLVPNMVRYEYPIQTFTKTAKVNGMIKVIDTATGDLATAERLEGQHVESDRVIAGDPQRNVPDDPLQLSDDPTMLERASDPAITRLRQVLSQACARHGQRFAARMQRAESAGDTTGAVDNSVKYLFAYPQGDEKTTRMIDYLRRYLGDESTLIDIRQLLRTHGQVLAGQ